MRSKRAPLRSGLGHFQNDHLFGRVTLHQFLRDVVRDFHCLFLSRDRNLDGLFGGALKRALFRQELSSRMRQPSRCAPQCVDIFCFEVCRVITTPQLPKKETTHTHELDWRSSLFMPGLLTFCVHGVNRRKKYQCKITNTIKPTGHLHVNEDEMKNQRNKNSKVDNDHECGWSKEREMCHD